ncbi:PKD domain-containing protein [candidate division WOR-3 bacterium]|nr:PKD domain-containing protein [candidate division WOR-3 bacterium]
MKNHLLLLLPALLSLAQGPVRELKLSLPDLKTAEYGGVTEVTIPGELLLLEEEGRPQVPYARREVSLPVGFRVREVRLVQAAAPETLVGIVLPVVRHDAYREDPVPMLPGRFPDKPVRWEQTENVDGSTVLMVSAFPFHYDPAAEVGVFCRSYEFTIDGFETGVTITGIGAARADFTPGGAAAVTLGLANSGAAQAVTVEAGVFDGERRVARLAARKLTLGAADSLTLTWNTDRNTAGDFEMRVSVSDASGRVLDRDQAWLRVGRPAAAISGFRVGPDPFRRGEDVLMESRVENTGNCVLGGAGVFTVSLGGDAVAELSEEFTDLKPGQARTLRRSWSTESTKPGAVYEVAALARFEGGATLAERTELSTNARPSAEFTVSPDTTAAGGPVRFDASGSADPDGRIVRFHWEFGDGGEGQGVNVNHTYPEAGEFIVTLTVTDDGGRTASAEKTVLVGE